MVSDAFSVVGVELGHSVFLVSAFVGGSVGGFEEGSFGEVGEGVLDGAGGEAGPVDDGGEVAVSGVSVSVSGVFGYCDEDEEFRGGEVVGGVVEDFPDDPAAHDATLSRASMSCVPIHSV